MKFSEHLAAITGTAIVTAIVTIQPQSVLALTGVEVNNIAREVTVLIRVAEGQGHGSGAIIAKEGNTYYVLTANHVVGGQNKYHIVTADKQVHELDYSQVKRLPGIDLAVVSFTSDKNYQVAKLANTSTVQQGQSVFVSGWPAPSQSINEITRQFTGGVLSSVLETPRQDGYALVYDSVTRRGMSGGPVFDSDGRIIGVHGLGDAETRARVQQSVSSDTPGIEAVADLIKSGLNLGIPINTFLQSASSQGLFLSWQVENSPPQQLIVNYTPPAQPDQRDRLNIEDVFQRSLERGVERGIERGIDRILPF
ncbi:S1 family peptidase [Oscillatoria salina]|uniref:S1 family peptidase n=1 Tax=Oscillatoria salina TaxID=331517 RepID=UPI001CCE0E15|nr:serine protease [Oscillatoria salina]MBZ8182830.1 trypsin-like peptidase domain-containing protein [Oscillatoria salina IIICB1]